MAIIKYFFFENHKIPEYLEPTSYFAYIDSIEVISTENEEEIEFRLDCVEINKVSSQNSIEELLLRPSIVINISEGRQYFQNIFNRKYLGLLEGLWVRFSTKKSVDKSLHVSYMGTSIVNSGIDLNTITPINDLDNDEWQKFSNLKKTLKLSKIANKVGTKQISQIRKCFTDFDRVSIYNVGQGNLNALCDRDNVPLIYYDMGGGFGANQSTYINTLKICTTYNPPVILSHWDLDHIETALRSNQSHSLSWYVPNQSLGITHFILAYRLSLLGNLFLLNNSLNFRSFSILQCNGRAKNDSGLAIYINKNYQKILLSGDSNYRRIPLPNGLLLDGLVATHHGSQRGLTHYRNNVIPLANNNNMLAFSYGIHNTYGHHPNNVINLYQQRGWALPHPNNYLETISGNIIMYHNPVSMHVPCGGSGCDLTLVQHY
jgi:beta-lactamase superfamily II metal-dependent hydrolase